MGEAIRNTPLICLVNKVARVQTAEFLLTSPKVPLQSAKLSETLRLQEDNTHSLHKHVTVRDMQKSVCKVTLLIYFSQLSLVLYTEIARTDQ